MAHSNSTTHYNLPQFAATDKPAWLVDVNPAYSAIDAGMYAAQQAADSAQADATQALDDAAAAAGSATTADAKGSGAIASLAESFDTTATYTVGEYVIYNNLLYICSTAVTNPGPWTGSTNWSRTTLDSIITDLKIEDLSDVSIDNTDNNKLLGVSVSGDDISVNAIAYDEITKPTDIGNEVNLSGYVGSSNKYTFPSDGYLYYENNNTTYGRGYINGAIRIGVVCDVAQKTSAVATFVRKGMNFYVVQNEPFYNIRFYPLT